MIPEELIAHVFSFLDYKNITSLSLVCKRWNQIANSNVYWKPIFESIFGKSPNVDYNFVPTNYKKHFKDASLVIKRLQGETLFKLSAFQIGEDLQQKFKTNSAIYVIGNSSFIELEKKEYLYKLANSNYISVNFKYYSINWEF